MVILTDAWRKQYEDAFASMVVDPARKSIALNVAKHIASHKDQYVQISKVTGVPWFMIGILHEREAGLNFASYLGDGEPLDHETHNAPKGRGPFKDFFTGAVDALAHEGFDEIKDWSLGSILFHMEEFNGEGYHNHGLPSPYVWSWSNKYQSGKYDRDGHFVSTLVDAQIGGAIIMFSLLQLGILVLQQTGGLQMVTDAISGAIAPAPAPVQAPVAAAHAATAGLNVSTTSIVTHVTSGVMSTLIGVLAPMMAVMMGQTTAHYLIGGLFGLAGFISAGANAYSLVASNSAASQNTIATINNLSAIAQQAAIALGGTPQGMNAGIASAA